MFICELAALTWLYPDDRHGVKQNSGVLFSQNSTEGKEVNIKTGCSLTFVKKVFI